MVCHVLPSYIRVEHEERSCASPSRLAWAAVTREGPSMEGKLAFPKPKRSQDFRPRTPRSTHIRHTIHCPTNQSDRSDGLGSIGQSPSNLADAGRLPRLRPHPIINQIDQPTATPTVSDNPRRSSGLLWERTMANSPAPFEAEEQATPGIAVPYSDDDEDDGPPVVVAREGTYIRGPRLDSRFDSATFQPTIHS